MASARVPGGFSIYQLLTRVIPGFLVVSVVLSIFTIDQMAEILSQNDDLSFYEVALDWIGLMIEYYLWVPILVGSIIIGEFIDITRRLLFPVPNSFRRYIYYHSGGEKDPSVLTFSQYISVWLEEKYKDPDKESIVQASIRHPYVWSLIIGLYISLWVGQVTYSFANGFRLFLISQLIAIPLVVFREEIRNIRLLVENPIYQYLIQSPTSHFDLRAPNECLKNIRTDCGFDEDLNDPAELYFGLNMLVDESSNTNTAGLRMIYQFNKNISLSLYLSLGVLVIAAVSGTVFQHLIIFLFIVVIIPIAMLYRIISNIMGVEYKFIRHLLIECHITRTQTK